MRVRSVFNPRWGIVASGQLIFQVSVCSSPYGWRRAGLSGLGVAFFVHWASKFRFKADCRSSIIFGTRYYVMFGLGIPLVNKASAGIIGFFCRRIGARYRSTDWRRPLGSFVRDSYCDGNMRIIRILLPQYLSPFTCALRRILPCFCASDFISVVRGSSLSLACSGCCHIWHAFLLHFVVNSTNMAWQVPALTFTRHLLVVMYVKCVLYVLKMCGRLCTLLN